MDLIGSLQVRHFVVYSGGLQSEVEVALFSIEKTTEQKEKRRQVGATIKSMAIQEIVFTTPGILPEEAWSPLAALVKTPQLLEVSGGVVKVPTAPGLGIEVSATDTDTFGAISVGPGGSLGGLSEWPSVDCTQFAHPILSPNQSSTGGRGGGGAVPRPRGRRRGRASLSCQQKAPFCFARCCCLAVAAH